MSKVIIIGAGAAGMMAGITAARGGHDVTILEKNEKAGKKLYITGKGRCNLTNACDNEELMDSIVSNKKFMYSAFGRFGSYDCMGFFDELGLKFKIERGNRVFPESDRASDVIDCLKRELRRLNVNIEYNTEATDILVSEYDGDGGARCGTSEAKTARRCTGVCARPGARVRDDRNGMSCDKSVKYGTGRTVTYECDELIVATGGCSYPSTGSTGAGYSFARDLGIEVTPLLPALVPVLAKEEWVKQLQGLSLKNIRINIMRDKKALYSDFGEMLFTHFGVSGPVVLSASSFIAKDIRQSELDMYIDLKPALDEAKLDERICRDFEEMRNKRFKNSLDRLLPKKLIPVVTGISGIDPDKKTADITAAQRRELVKLLKGLKITLTGLRGFNEAIITQGGIDVREINPSTMQCKKIPNLRFAGEVLDVDALTGGFNLQVAWSTAYLAASGIKA